MSRTFNHAILRIKNAAGNYDALSALRGQNSYELAVKLGFTGSEEEWMESIIGDGWVGAFQELETIVNTKASVSYLPATIVDAWTGTTAPFIQEVSVPGILETDRPHIDLIVSDDYTEAEEQTIAFGSIYRVVTATDKIIVYSSNNFNTPLQIQIEVIR